MGLFPHGIKWVEQEVDLYIVLRLKMSVTNNNGDERRKFKYSGM
jgi:hypothetical protein